MVFQLWLLNSVFDVVAQYERLLAASFQFQLKSMPLMSFTRLEFCATLATSIPAISGFTVTVWPLTMMSEPSTLESTEVWTLDRTRST